MMPILLCMVLAAFRNEYALAVQCSAKWVLLVTASKFVALCQSIIEFASCDS